MLLRGFTSAAEYAQLVERDRAEAETLFRDVPINVTSFFRDPEMFEDLKRQVFPQIARSGADDAPIRVWVPGCSTGQEAYSVAIALVEYLESVYMWGPLQERLIPVFHFALNRGGYLVLGGVPSLRRRRRWQLLFEKGCASRTKAPSSHTRCACCR